MLYLDQRLHYVPLIERKPCAMVHPRRYAAGVPTFYANRPISLH
jgi:hypothetical protein